MLFMSIESENDRQKVIRLYYNYRALMYKTAYGILGDAQLAEDAVHDSFEKVIKHLQKIDEGNTASTRSFLVVVCRNTALTIAGQKNPLTSFNDAPEDTAYKNTLLDIVITRETLCELVAAIESLNPIYRDTFILRRVYNMSRGDIAALLGISAETVKKRLYRAKQKITDKLLEVSRDE